VSAQVWAVAIVLAVVLTFVALERLRAAHARKQVLHASAGQASAPYILYFTGEGCTVCRTHQEPALAKLEGVRIDRIDALAERDMAERFHVYTLPTTVVMSAQGQVVQVNYGYAAAGKLARQLAEAEVTGGAATMSASARA
jgi:thiol-disulfide isomerase/thioredoxin